MEWLIPLLTLASAFGGVRVALNGTVKRVERIEAKLDTILPNHGERIAKIEAKIE